MWRVCVCVSEHEYVQVCRVAAVFIWYNSDGVPFVYLRLWTRCKWSSPYPYTPLLEARHIYNMKHHVFACVHSPIAMVCYPFCGFRVLVGRDLCTCVMLLWCSFLDRMASVDLFAVIKLRRGRERERERESDERASTKVWQETPIYSTSAPFCLHQQVIFFFH